MDSLIVAHLERQIADLEREVRELQYKYVMAEKKVTLAEKQSSQDATIARKAEQRAVYMQQQMHAAEARMEAMKELHGAGAFDAAQMLVKQRADISELKKRIEYLEKERKADGDLLSLIHRKTGVHLGYDEYIDDSDSDSDDE
jgi:multidrug resistance efflux pump